MLLTISVKDISDCAAVVDEFDDDVVVFVDDVVEDAVGGKITLLPTQDVRLVVLKLTAIDTGTCFLLK